MRRTEYWVCADTFEMPYKKNVTVSDILSSWEQDCSHKVYTDLAEAVKAYTHIPVSTSVETSFSGNKFIQASVASIEAVVTEYDEDEEEWLYVESADASLNWTGIPGSGFRAETLNA